MRILFMSVCKKLDTELVLSPLRLPWSSASYIERNIGNIYYKLTRRPSMDIA